MLLDLQSGSERLPLRLHPDILKRLKRLAHQQSLERDREVTWTTMVREALERLVTQQERHNG